MEKSVQVIFVVIVTFLLCTIVLQAGFNSKLHEDIGSLEERIHNYKIEDANQDFNIETLQAENNVLKQEVEDWKQLYYSYEPKIIYRNKTRYVEVYTNIYIDDAIFDVNRDNSVDYTDVAEVFWYINHGISIIEDWVFNRYGNPYEKLYDVNSDGNVNLLDVDLIWEYAN